MKLAVLDYAAKDLSLVGLVDEQNEAAILGGDAETAMLEDPADYRVVMAVGESSLGGQQPLGIPVVVMKLQSLEMVELGQFAGWAVLSLEAADDGVPAEPIVQLYEAARSRVVMGRKERRRIKVT